MVVMQNWLEQKDFLLYNRQWAIILGIIILGPLFTIAFKSSVKYLFFRKRKELLVGVGEKLQHSFDRSFSLIFMFALTFFALPYLELTQQTEKSVSKIIGILLTVCCFYFGYNLINIFSKQFLKFADQSDNKFDDIFVPMFNKASKVILFCLFLVYLAKSFGVDVTGLVAGLGIGGLAFAFAAKDTLSNLFGSLMIVLDRPFEIGDYIVIDGIEGSVTEVGFRSTRVRTFYDSLITVPNNILSTKHVDNLGKRRYRRLNTKIGIEYDTPVEKIEAFCEGIRTIVASHPKTRKDTFHIYFNEMGASSLNILLYVFWEVASWSEELNEKQRLYIDIMRLAKQMNINFAFPTTTLHTFNHEIQNAELPKDLEEYMKQSSSTAKQILSQTLTAKDPRSSSNCL